jgi:hypothetical protein
MAEKTPGSLGTIVEEKIYPHNPGKRTHQVEWSKPRIAHLECCPEQSRTHHGPLILGTAKWYFEKILE